MAANETGSGGGYRLRVATLDDASAVAEIWRTGWADGHAGNVPPELVRHREDIKQYVSRARDRVDSMWVAVSGEGGILGFVVVKEDELEQVYVDRAARGTGVAALLLRRGEDEVRRAGHRRAWLAVVFWLQKDARRTGVGAVLDLGYFVLTAWPVVIPWYAFQTRGEKGWRLTTTLFALIAAPYLTWMLAVGFASYFGPDV
jgi:GNAT superfamily N-acetyltransferase